MLFCNGRPLSPLLRKRERGWRSCTSKADHVDCTPAELYKPNKQEVLSSGRESSACGIKLGPRDCTWVGLELGKAQLCLG